MDQETKGRLRKWVTLEAPGRALELFIFAHDHPFYEEDDRALIAAPPLYLKHGVWMTYVIEQSDFFRNGAKWHHVFRFRFPPVYGFFTEEDGRAIAELIVPNLPRGGRIFIDVRDLECTILVVPYCGTITNPSKTAVVK